MTKKPSVASNTQFNISSSLMCNGIRRVFTALLATFMLMPVTSHAVETLCARVKIEIVQELTLERQAFDAMPFNSVPLILTIAQIAVI